MTRINNIAIALAFILGSPSLAAAISITTTDDTTIFSSMLDGLNVTGITYDGDPAASGIFTAGTSSGVGLDSGIILTTGTAAAIDGATNDEISDFFLDFATSTGYWTTDTDGRLSTLATSSGSSTSWVYDVVTLSIEFTLSAGESVTFSYFIGAEKYNEFGDIYAIYLNDDELVENNLFINDPDLALTVSDTSLNSTLFEYDRYTSVYTIDVSDAGTYTLTLLIGDLGTAWVDSGLFLSADFTPVPEPASLLLFGSGLAGLAGIRSRKKAAQKQNERA